ncbi:hypothetical protein [Streptomyces deserti]
MAADTVVTFTVQGAQLTVAAPANAVLPSTSIGGRTTGQLGTVTVRDERGVVPAPWTATVASSDFSTGGGSPNEKIAASNAGYWSGPATATSGSGVFTPGQPTSGDAVTLAAARTAFTHSGGGGGNSASWNPTLFVDVPQTAAAGLYTGTVTHSVA